jgi:hypothetical protein
MSLVIPHVLPYRLPEVDQILGWHNFPREVFTAPIQPDTWLWNPESGTFGAIFKFQVYLMNPAIQFYGFAIIQPYARWVLHGIRWIGKNFTIIYC